MISSGTFVDGVGLLEDTWVIVGEVAVNSCVSSASASYSYCACMREPPIGSTLGYEYEWGRVGTHEATRSLSQAAERIAQLHPSCLVVRSPVGAELRQIMAGPEKGEVWCHCNSAAMYSAPDVAP